jgi:hypothetical protein
MVGHFVCCQLFLQASITILNHDYEVIFNTYFTFRDGVLWKEIGIKLQNIWLFLRHSAPRRIN